jgi:kumamolisin
MTDASSDASFVPLPGSERAELPGATPAGELDGTERIEVTLVTRRMAELPLTPAGTPARLDPGDLAQYGSDPADQALVAEILASPSLGIEVVSRDPAARLMTISGTAAALSQVFGTTLSMVTSTGPGGATVRHRYRQGGLRIPAELDGIIVAVLGLDDRPQARFQLRRRAGSAAGQVSYTPPQVAVAYQFPGGTDGSGQHVAILEFGGGFAASDLDSYFGGLGITTPSVTAVDVAGGSNVPGQDPSGADGEVLLDIEVIGSIAPGAIQLVYFAANNDQGFVSAVSAAVHATPAPAAISVSWGESEDSWTAQARTSLDAAMADAVAAGITVCAAAGDGGSSDGVTGGGVHVDFPASSPHALACGGTTLQADPQTGAITSETVWNDGASNGATGGGISDVFTLPSWQASAGVPASASSAGGRGVPDVAGNADPDTGYEVLIDGQSTVVGGTSAVAPLWAALTCRLAQAAGHSLGLLQEILYAGAQPQEPVTGLRDITQGDNGAYSAEAGWDACTGLGSPDGSALLTQVTAASPAGAAVTAG